MNFFLFKRGENVEEAFLETAKKIYQNILDGNLDLNAAETGVQPKQPLNNNNNNTRQTNDQNKPESSCNC
jgi:Ras-related protein Rab-14